jgi:hypothetical protein
MESASMAGMLAAHLERSTSGETPGWLKEIGRMKKGPDGLDGDYFVDAQDFDELWAKNITVSDVKISGTKASAEVLLAGKGDMRRRLQVSLVKDGSIWKVDKVKGRE